jgi:pimeloyl-ACP methyl ester carboxylesterase
MKTILTTSLPTVNWWLTVIKMNRKIIFPAAFSFILAAASCLYYIHGPRVNELVFPEINGIRQAMLIRTRDRNNPVLLYLHGGPGDSLIPCAYVATRDLVNRFTVVYWDQRGTGLSYRKDLPSDTFTIRQFIDDTKSVTGYLKRRFGKNKIYLLGHSWGSVLGLLVIQDDPESYYAYIGAGQVISLASIKSERIKWLEHQISNTNTEDEDRLRIAKENKYEWVDGHSFTGPLIHKYGGYVHNISEDDKDKIYMGSPYWKLYSWKLYDEGEMISSPLVNEEENIDFKKTAQELRIPIYFFLGRFDYIAPVQPVVEYYRILKAPRKRIVWFEKSSHHMDIEEPEKFQKEIINILDENGR